MAEDYAAVLNPLTRHINERDLLALARDWSDTFKHLAEHSNQHFLATPVTALPTGRETGTFLAIDVGGTNLRVGFVELLGDIHDKATKIRRSHEHAWPIEEHMKFDQADDLFAWIGECIAKVVSEALYGDKATLTMHQELRHEIPMGITFSFPMKQDSISQATLMPMGKGFAITSDLNLGQMLLAGYSRHSGGATTITTTTPTTTPNGPLSPANSRPSRQQLPSLRIAAITNDTVATYASLAYSTAASSSSNTNPRHVVMGLVVGTGTNATVPMPLAALSPSKTKSLRLPATTAKEEGNAAKVVVNTEWSVTGTDAPLRRHRVPTPWDLALDAACECPGFQPVEYMTAGRYLGELVRLALVQLLPEQCCGGASPPALLRRNAVSTRWLAEVVAGADDRALRASLDDLFPPAEESGFVWTKERMGLLRAVARAVQVRSAALVAAMIVGLLARVGEVHLHDDDDLAQKEDEVDGALVEEEQLVVAHTGGVILQYPGYLEICEKWIDTLVSKGSRKNASKRVVLGEAKDGGVIGAAVLAGMFTGVAL